jgi:uncharacterized protein YdaU (DUF1376 family)
MAELFSFPLKPADLIADTNHLTAEEFGAHVRILLTMWLQGGRLRNDDAELARIAGISRRRWRTMRERVMRSFTTINDEISQKRLTDTLVSIREMRRQKSLAAQARWSPNTHASALRTQCNRNAIKTKTEQSVLTGESERAKPQQGAIDASKIAVSAELAANVAKKARR